MKFRMNRYLPLLVLPLLTSCLPDGLVCENGRCYLIDDPNPPVCPLPLMAEQLQGDFAGRTDAGKPIEIRTSSGRIDCITTPCILPADQAIAERPRIRIGCESGELDGPIALTPRNPRCGTEPGIYAPVAWVPNADHLAFASEGVLHTSQGDKRLKIEGLLIDHQIMSISVSIDKSAPFNATLQKDAAFASEGCAAPGVVTVSEAQSGQSVDVPLGSALRVLLEGRGAVVSYDSRVLGEIGYIPPIRGPLSERTEFLFSTLSEGSTELVLEAWTLPDCGIVIEGDELACLAPVAVRRVSFTINVSRPNP